MKIKNTKTITVQDWNDCVVDAYGRPYNFQQQDDCHERGTLHLTVPCAAYDFENETIPETDSENTMGVSFNAWLARDPKKKLKNQEYDWELELWWERNFYPNIQMVANDLHNRGLLEVGEYVIEIDW